MQKLFIGGKWRNGHYGSAAVRNPWSGEVVGEYALGTAEDASEAVTAAGEALCHELPAHRRAEILTAVSATLLEDRERFADAIMQESGKPITLAQGEVERGATTIALAAEEARRLAGESVPMDAVSSGEGMLAFTIPQPLGVVAAITPFNFPLNLVAHKVGPAIAAGCPVVLKPSERTPLTAGLLVEAFQKSRLPDGWLNLVTGDPREISDVWMHDPRVAVVTFTGSPAIGWQLKASSPQKHHVLELGSNTAMVVASDADLDRAVETAATAAFAFAGQVCISLQRVYVEDQVADDFCKRLTTRAESIPWGDPADPDTVVGPVISTEAIERIKRWIDEAIASGATLLAGGQTEGPVVVPTVLADVPEDSALICDEAFAPVVSINRVHSVEEALQRVNASRFGLNASIHTQSLSTALTFARGVEAGTCVINGSPSLRTDHMPYGGVKDSGQGREGVRYAVQALLEPRLVVLDSR